MVDTPRTCRTIYRYPLEITDRQLVKMPHAAALLHVAPSRTRPDELDLWAVVDTIEPAVDREILIVGTGNPLPDTAGRHVGSCITHGGSAAWHVFESVSP